MSVLSVSDKCGCTLFLVIFRDDILVLCISIYLGEWKFPRNLTCTNSSTNIQKTWIYWESLCNTNSINPGLRKGTQLMGNKKKVHSKFEYTCILIRDPLLDGMAQGWGWIKGFEWKRKEIKQNSLFYVVIHVQNFLGPYFFSWTGK